MRIIAGTAGGRKLKSIKGTLTRPTLDRIKESIFNMIAPYIYRADVLDLYAGFGGLGLEAASRGASKVDLVEKDYRNIRVIKENIKTCNFDKFATAYPVDVFDFINNANKEYNLILLDPPYNKGLNEKTIEMIGYNGILAGDGIIVAEQSILDEVKQFHFLDIIKNKKYGDTNVVIYRQRGG